MGLFVISYLGVFVISEMVGLLARWRAIEKNRTLTALILGYLNSRTCLSVLPLSARGSQAHRRATSKELVRWTNQEIRPWRNFGKKAVHFGTRFSSIRGGLIERAANLPNASIPIRFRSVL